MEPPAHPPEPRPSATVILLRDAEAGAPEVLLLRRHAKSGFAPKAWVFPGGTVDDADLALADGRETPADAELALRVGLSVSELLAARVAAVRETFEEAGVLLAEVGTADGGRRPAQPDLPGLAELRRAMNDRADPTGNQRFADYVAAHDLVLRTDAVVPLSRWITPLQEPRRYDTLFFVTAMPAGWTASQDDVETTDARWISPAAALAGEVDIIFPTIKNLEVIAGQPSAAAVLSHAAGLGRIQVVQPHIQIADDGTFIGILMPGEDGYPTELLA